jgi:hypothetical protein
MHFARMTIRAYTSQRVTSKMSDLRTGCALWIRCALLRLKRNCKRYLQSSGKVKRNTTKYMQDECRRIFFGGSKLGSKFFFRPRWQLFHTYVKHQPGSFRLLMFDNYCSSLFPFCTLVLYAYDTSNMSLSDSKGTTEINKVNSIT